MIALESAKTRAKITTHSISNKPLPVASFPFPQSNNDYPLLLSLFIAFIILLEVILMSEQIDGFLQMKSSYNFDRQKN